MFSSDNQTGAAGRRSWPVNFCIYSGVILFGGLIVTQAVYKVGDLTLRQLADSGAPAPVMDGETRLGTMVQTSDEWMQQVRSGEIFKKKRRARSNKIETARRMSLGRPVVRKGRDDENGSGASFYSGGGGNYRTLCVRSCDGFYFPISFSTSRRNFRRDQRKCQSRCGTDAKLYVYRMPGGNIEDMKSIKGRPYKKLKTAFLFRAAYNPSCKCRPHSWETEASKRHDTYKKIAVLKKQRRTRARRKEVRKLRKSLRMIARASARSTKISRKMALASFKSGQKVASGSGSRMIQTAAFFPAPIRAVADVAATQNDRFYTPISVLAASEAQAAETVLIPEGASRTSHVIPATWPEDQIRSSRYDDDDDEEKYDARKERRQAARERRRRRAERRAERKSERKSRRRASTSWGTSMSLGRSSTKRTSRSAKRTTRARSRNSNSWKQSVFSNNR